MEAGIGRRYMMGTAEHVGGIHRIPNIFCWVLLKGWTEMGGSWKAEIGENPGRMHLVD